MSPCYYHVTMLLPCHRVITMSPCYHHVTMLSPCHHVITMLLCYHHVTMLSSCRHVIIMSACYHHVTMLSSCRHVIIMSACYHHVTMLSSCHHVTTLRVHGAIKKCQLTCLSVLLYLWTLRGFSSSSCRTLFLLFCCIRSLSSFSTCTLRWGWRKSNAQELRDCSQIMSAIFGGGSGPTASLALFYQHPSL